MSAFGQYFLRLAYTYYIWAIIISSREYHLEDSVAMEKSELAANLKRFRTACGISQEKLAQKSGVTYSTLIKIEAGYNTNPKVQSLIRLAKALGVTVTDLLGV